MSEYFTGVTFPEQKVTPSDDAIFHRAVLPDGILTGCAFSYSGSTLTMGAGYLLICGRIVRHTAVQNWSIVDASSGYARLVLTVDLTQAATKDAFEQVLCSVEYAASANGFAVLEQTDINDTGTKYQIAACVVSLGSGGITGIVKKLPTAVPNGARPKTVLIDYSNLAAGTWTETLEDGTVIRHQNTYDEEGRVIAVDGMTIKWGEL